VRTSAPAGDALHGEGPGGPLWGILDCARDKGLIRELEAHPAEHRCLFTRVAAEVEAASPHLVRLPEGSRLLHRWRTEGLEVHWGILFRSEEGIESLRRFFRQHLMVTLPDGKRAVFRFYDPRVFRDLRGGAEELAVSFAALASALDGRRLEGSQRRAAASGPS
jgi:hypothetical protein